MRLSFQGARLIDAVSDRAADSLTIDGGRIVAAGDASITPDGVVDVTDMIITPGFIDVHTHGGGGFNLHTADSAEIDAYARWAPATGVTSFLIAVVGSPDELPIDQLLAATHAIANQHGWRGGAEPLGIHLEGPYISTERRGAHMPSWLRLPSDAETEQLLALTNGHLRLITVAPELPGATALIERMIAAGVTVSLGHTDATYEQAQEAIQLGVTHVTHCCNAMRPLHHREPGPLGAVAQSPAVYGELIADGVHVHPAMMRILVRALGPERVIVITDALAGAGMSDASFEFAGQPAQVVSGAARLADGTITGSVLTLDQALRNMLRMTDATLQEAVGMLTRNPAHAAHAATRKGRLLADYDADLLIFDADLTLQATICCGQLAFATAQWRARLASAGLE